MQLSKVVQAYEFCTESWREIPTTGTPPHGMYDCATTHSDHILYLYGGSDGASLYASLYQLDTRSMTWTQLSPQHDSGPMRKRGCRIISYYNLLIVIGGYGIPSGLQSGSQFIKHNHCQDGGGYTNEVHMFNIPLGER